MEVTIIEPFVSPDFEANLTDTEIKIWALISSGVKQNIIDARKMLNNGAYRDVTHVEDLNSGLIAKEKKLGILIQNINYEELLNSERHGQYRDHYKDNEGFDDISKAYDCIVDLSKLLSLVRKKIKKSDLLTVSGDQKKNLTWDERISFAEQILNKNENFHTIQAVRWITYKRKIQALRVKFKSELMDRNND